MKVLGISGSFDTGEETKPFFRDQREFHDAAAVLVIDGEVVAGVEQERLDRIKHSNKFPVDAIRFCLQQAHIEIDDVDVIAYNWDDAFLDGVWAEKFLSDFSGFDYSTTRAKMLTQLDRMFSVSLDSKVRFVRHHDAHIASAIQCAGFDSCLAVSMDGWGDHYEAGAIATFRDGEEPVVRARIHQRNSLGALYHRGLSILGYKLFDEYKVMGLAPYGDPTRFEKVFSGLYDLLPDGEFELRSPSMADMMSMLNIRRRPGQPFLQEHKDFAAALQKTLETLAFHVLSHHRRTTGLTRLALAGGVAHNCTMNGKLLTSGLFDEVFVQPAAHDAGGAMGAALHVSRTVSGTRGQRLRNLYWGPAIGDDEAIREELDRWDLLVTYERIPEITKPVAEALASGAVVGWVQGRSEFGPRALGNRSILADPRPAANKERINAMVKKREGYRPFAPSVLRENVRDYFVVPEGQDSFPFMIFIFDVRADKRDLLGAITHVDGTARVQTVSRDENPLYWELIQEFGKRTHVPMLLNTSFNNDAEPIVDSVRDGIVCFLTTNIDLLAVGNFLVKKRPGVGFAAFANMIPELPAHISLVTRQRGDKKEVSLSATNGKVVAVPDVPQLHALLERVDGKRSLRELAGPSGDSLLDSVLDLWGKRVLRLSPA